MQDMEVDIIFKIAGVGLIVAVLSQILSRSDKGEYTMLLTIAGIIVVILMILPEIEEFFSDVRKIIDF